MQTMPKATRHTGPMTNGWDVCHGCKAAKQWHGKHPDGMSRAAFKHAHAPAPGIFTLVCATVVHKGHHSIFRQNVRLAPGARSDIHVMTARHRHHTGGSMAIALPLNSRQRLRLNLRTAITTTQLNRFVAPTAYWGLPSKAALTVTAIYSPPQNGPFGNSKQAETACRTAHTATPNSTKAQPSGCQQITRSLNSKAQDRQTGLEV